jgi:hypothetical protein
MKNKYTLLAIFILFLNMSSFAQKSTGYLGRTNAISVSLSDFAFNKLNLEYKKTVSKRIFLWGMYSIYTIEENIYEPGSGKDVFSVFTREYTKIGEAAGKGYDMGIGVAYSYTGMEKPLGNYITLAYVRSHCSANEIVDRTKETIEGESLNENVEEIQTNTSYKYTANSYRVFLGKDLPIHARFSIDYRLEFGLTVYYIDFNHSKTHDTYMPKDLYPAFSPLNPPSTISEKYHYNEAYATMPYKHITGYTGFNLRFEFHL